MYKYSTIYTKNNMKGLVGGPLLVGGLGPGPPGPPLNPALPLPRGTLYGKCFAGILPLAPKL